jgi:hypothetical protein
MEVVAVVVALGAKPGMPERDRSVCDEDGTLDGRIPWTVGATGQSPMADKCRANKTAR